MKSKNNATWVLLLAVVLTIIGALQKFQGPSPDPPPPPHEVSGPGSWVVLLEETSQRTPYIVRVVEQFSANGVSNKREVYWRTYDKDVAGAERLAVAAKDLTLPAVIILSPDKKIIDAWELPPTLEEIDALVKEVTGQ